MSRALDKQPLIPRAAKVCLRCHLLPESRIATGRWLTLGLLVGMLASPAEAQRIALVIGNANYIAERKLSNPHRDAEAIKKVLTEKLGFRKEDVEVLKDQNFKSTVSALLSFRKKVDGAEIALIYYSGHGIAFNDANYMAPTDVPLNLIMHNDDKDPIVHLDEIQRAISGAKVGVVFWDACRSSGVSPTIAVGARNPTSATRDLIPERVTSPGTNSVATFLAFSTNPRETADDGPDGDLSPFTKAIVKRIGERGRSFLQVMASVSEDVERATKKGGRAQIPEVRFPRMSPAAVSFYFLPPDRPQSSGGSGAGQKQTPGRPNSDGGQHRDNDNERRSQIGTGAGAGF